MFVIAVWLVIYDASTVLGSCKSKSGLESNFSPLSKDLDFLFSDWLGLELLLLEGLGLGLTFVW